MGFSDILRHLRCKKSLQGLLPLLLSLFVATAPLQAYTQQTSQSHSLQGTPPLNNLNPAPEEKTASLKLENAGINDEDIDEALNQVIEELENEKLQGKLRNFIPRIIPALRKLQLDFLTKKQQLQLSVSKKEITLLATAYLIINSIIAGLSSGRDNLGLFPSAFMPPTHRLLVLSGYVAGRLWSLDPTNELEKAQTYIHSELLRIGTYSDIHLLLYETLEGKEVFLAVRHHPVLPGKAEKIIRDSKGNVETTYLRVADMRKIINNPEFVSRIERLAVDSNDLKNRLLAHIVLDRKKREKLEKRMEQLKTPNMENSRVEALVRLTAVKRKAMSLLQISSFSIWNILSLKRQFPLGRDWKHARKSQSELERKIRQAQQLESQLVRALRDEKFELAESLETEARFLIKELTMAIEQLPEHVNSVKPSFAGSCQHIIAKP